MKKIIATKGLFYMKIIWRWYQKRCQGKVFFKKRTKLEVENIYERSFFYKVFLKILSKGVHRIDDKKRNPNFKETSHMKDRFHINFVWRAYQLECTGRILKKTKPKIREETFSIKDCFYMKLIWILYQWGHTASLHKKIHFQGTLSISYK